MSSALDRLASRGVSTPGERGIDIPLSKIRFDSTQPRKAYHHLDGRVAESDEAYIAELAQTIDENGLIQAITVQEMGDGTYLVVVGECRTRAHLLLGKATIRAVVRNDLTNASRRLLYQLVENVTRQKLTDQELSVSIQKLKEGGDGVEPMSQVQIAKTLGKSEGWVSRFVKFGDEELQRLWVKPGIADSVENLYRISILPSAMQVDIRRRVDLPENDPEWLEKPLRRETIDRLTKEAKAVKKKDATKADAPAAGSAPSATPMSAPPVSSPSVGNAAGEAGVAPHPETNSASISLGTDAPSEDGGGWKNTFNGAPTDQNTDPFTKDLPGLVQGQSSENGATDGATLDAGQQAAALAAAVVGGHTEPAAAPAAPASDKYQLPDDVRAAILGSVGNADVTGAQSGATTGEAVAAPVNCRVPVSSVLALLEVLRSDESMLQSFDGVQCELNIPGGLAQLIANQLAGVIVDRKEVPALMQRELSKLGQ